MEATHKEYREIANLKMQRIVNLADRKRHGQDWRTASARPVAINLVEQDKENLKAAIHTVAI